MSVFSSCLGRMLYSWMSLLMQVVSLVLGLSGLVLLRLRLLTLTSSVGSYSEQRFGSWAGECFVQGCQAWWSQGTEGSWQRI